ncbi:MAG: SPFH domain-containing protein [Deltaproteobacteria bacterium]|nr:SPFH domain-containing protein [Deltaproteobacteria bacterium]
MNAQDWLMLFGGAAAGAAGLSVLGRIARGFGVAVEDEHVALVTSFGRIVAKLEKPGLHVLPGKWLPWVKVHHVSRALDFRIIHDLHINDARGTTVVADLWVEVRVVDAEKALFAVEDWDQATQNLVVHAAMSILGSRDFQQILDDRSELGALLERDVSGETLRWGVKVERVFIRHVSLLPEVSRQVFGTVATRLERARAVVVEKGRLDAAALEAETSKRVATLVAEAKSQYLLAVGRALERLRQIPAVFTAYNQLYDLAQLRGARTVAFRGFDNDMRPIEAAMLPTSANPIIGTASDDGTDDRM